MKAITFLDIEVPAEKFKKPKISAAEKAEYLNRAVGILSEHYQKKQTTGEEDYDMLDAIYDMADRINDTLVINVKVPNAKDPVPVPFVPRWILAAAERSQHPKQIIELLQIRLAGGKTMR